MAKSAYVLLGTGGVVERVHTPDIHAGGSVGGPGVPTTGAPEVESLMSLGYVAKREIPLDGGKVLLVMEKP